MSTPVGFPHTDSSDPEGEPSPLVDASRWDQLIEEVRPAAFLVVIASSMGKVLRAHCSPEDIWQDTLALAWRARAQHRWQGSAAFRAWLFEIARNRIRDAARYMETEKRGGGRPAARLSGFGSASDAVRLPPDSVTPSRILMHIERATAMERALAALPADLEPVVRMHVLEDLTMEVIAERLGIGISTAWRRFRKGSEIYSRSISEWTSDGSRALP